MISTQSTSIPLPVIEHKDAAECSEQIGKLTVGNSGLLDFKQLTDFLRHFTASTAETEGQYSGRLFSFSSTLDKVTEDNLKETMRSLENSFSRWNPVEYHIEKLLQPARTNFGQVDCVRRQSDGKMLAVKRMPRAWMRTGHESFKHTYPTSIEQPWKDVAMVKLLNDLKFPYACGLHGLFRDEDNMYIATALASGGDLLAWCQEGPRPSLEREQMIAPFVVQCCSAVRHLHDLNVAHLDLSLENILLDNSSGEPRIKLIDFGQAHVSRFCEPATFSKVIYRAPEVMGREMFDAFKADIFSLGVVIYIMTCQDYPWTSASDSCCLFRFVQKYGLNAFAARRCVRQGNGETLASVLSSSLLALLSAVLELNPSMRSSLGEQCYSRHEEFYQMSVWDFPWMHLPVGRGAVEHV